MKIEVIIPGPPIAWKRAGRNGKFYYDKQIEDKKKYQQIAMKVSGITIPRPIEPVKLDLLFYMPIPKSLSNKAKMILLDSYHYKKPDLDNLVKFVMDAFNGILYNDDSNIAKINCSKSYDLEPRTIVRIQSL